MATNLLRPTPPPVLPVPEEGYKQTSWQLFMNTLRVYFTSIAKTLNTLVGDTGGRFLEFPYAHFYDTTTQTAPANTVTRVNFNNILYAKGFTATTPPGQGLVVTNSGYYNVQFSFQCANNSSSTIDNITVWFRVNGVDVPNTASIAAIPTSHGGITGYLIMAANFVFKFTAGDIITMWWANDSGNSFLYTFPASVSPAVHPAAPSAVITMQYMAAV